MKFIDKIIHICPYCDKVDIDTYYDERGYVVYKCHICTIEHKTDERIRWRTLKGEKIEIEKMDDIHINNCLNMLRRMIGNALNSIPTDGDYEDLELREYQQKIERYKFWINLFETELKDREGMYNEKDKRYV